MTLCIMLEDTETGVLAEHTEETYECMEFQWRENNYSCDCNRGLFFYGIEKQLDFPCGHTRFRIREARIIETGEILPWND